MRKYYNYIFKERANVFSSLKTRLLATFCGSFLLLGAFTSCDKGMNDVSGEFYHRAEDLYLGVVDSLKVFPGYEKAKFTWEVKADPRITKVVIYWDKRKDSTVVDVQRDKSERIVMEYELNDLTEKDYIFEVVTKNESGLFSLTKQVATSIYGDVYVKGLRNRVIASTKKLDNGDFEITWDPIASSSILYATVKFEVGGAAQELKVENKQEKTVLTGLQSGDIFKVSTSYLPEKAIDVLTSLEESHTLP